MKERNPREYPLSEKDRRYLQEIATDGQPAHASWPEPSRITIASIQRQIPEAF